MLHPVRPTALAEPWMQSAWQHSSCQATCGRTSSMKHLLAEIDHHSRDRKVLAGEKKGCPSSKRIEQPMVRKSEAASTLADFGAVNYGYQVKRRPICWLRMDIWPGFPAT